jgi:hypothetical protein
MAEAAERVRLRSEDRADGGAAAPTHRTSVSQTQIRAS